MKPQIWVNNDNGDPPAAELHRPVSQPYRLTKPTGGMWTSTLGEEQGWLGWLKDEGYGDAKPGDRWHVASKWKLTVRPDATIYEIDSLADLVRLIELYPSENTHPMFDRHVEWLAVAEDFDGVHLTAAGQWRTRMPLRSDEGVKILIEANAEKKLTSLADFSGLNREMLPDLYGWDCESTLWFNWAFDSVERV